MSIKLLTAATIAALSLGAGVAQADDAKTEGVAQAKVILKFGFGYPYYYQPHYYGYPNHYYYQAPACFYNKWGYYVCKPYYYY